jgi:hypothetical protein
VVTAGGLAGDVAATGRAGAEILDGIRPALIGPADAVLDRVPGRRHGPKRAAAIRPVRPPPARRGRSEGWTAGRKIVGRMSVIGLAALVPLSLMAQARAGETPPTTVGACAQSAITHLGTRFSATLTKPAEGTPGEGTSVELKNGVYGISYAYVEAIGNSRIGDPVTTCLVSIPKGCPKDDDRGRFYKTTNLRTLESWTLPDSQHMCGGA